MQNCIEVIQIRALDLSIDNQLSNNGITNINLAKQSKSSRMHYVAKSAVDKLISLSVLIALSPMLLLVAIFIKLDSKGPVIFRQKRNGLNNQEFLIWKFRTMRVMENGANVKQAEKGDSRITRTGSFLRKSSIDELPQLVNVLLGDMSIVGPRPHPVALNDHFRSLIENYDKRCTMKPGLTGLAQINGHRGPTDTVEQMSDRIEYDIRYITTWSFWSDLKIMLATPYYGLISKNAF